jgi:hypothetical protein
LGISQVNVYALIPTALKPHCSSIFAAWKAKGYKLGLFIDPGSDSPCDLLIRAPYPGVWNAWNALARAAVSCGADVCVLVGDDMEPDPNHTAQEIGETYLDRFPHGGGILQPCGDLQGVDDSGRPAAARICGSPIMGREWIKRAYQGNGPVDGRYNAFYADESLKHVAEQLGRLWMEPTLSHFHRHWSWGALPRQPYHERNQRRWAEDKKLFEESLAAGFPEGEWL